MPARVVALVKPQFEAGKEQVPRGGVVRDPSVWAAVLADVADGAADAGLHPASAIRSPITGGDGNVEFLVDLRTAGADAEAFRRDAGRRLALIADGAPKAPCRGTRVLRSAR